MPSVPPLSRRERWALGLLLLAPIAIMPGALNRFVFAKVAISAAGGGLALLGAGRGRWERRIGWLLAGGALLLLIAALHGAAPVVQLLGRGPRYEGVVVLAVYLLAGVAGARLLGPARAPGTAARLGRLLAVAAVCVAVLAVLEVAGWRPLSSNVSRPGSLLGNASDEGAFGVLIGGPLLALGVVTRDRWALTGAGAGLVTVALSGSRGALLGALVSAAVLFAVLSGRGQRIAIGCGLVGLAVLTLIVPASRSRTLGTSPLAGETVHGRLLLWRETLSLLGGHPVLGVGPSGFGDAIVAEHTLAWQQQIGPANPPDSPHDWVLQAAVAGGLPLALLALVMAALTGWRGWVAARREQAERAPPLVGGLLAGLAGYGAALLVHLSSPGPTSLAAVFGGALLARAPTEASRSRWAHRSEVALPVGLAAFLTVVLAAAAVAEIPLRAGIVAMTEGRLAVAARDFRLALDLRPWDVEVALTAGHAYAVAALAGQHGAAGAGTPWLRTALRWVPTSEQVRTDLAAVEEVQGNVAGAAALLDAALARDPDNPQLLLRRGVVAAELGADGPAERDFLLASRIDPLSPDPWSDLALLYGEEHRAADAARAAARAAGLRTTG
ncbi:MAG TPA: O-antigen ligase family protein [Mycobacteriales bacterium]|nr:O-antigen ligase family protein [Mycobacteriales bacterium]